MVDTALDLRRGAATAAERPTSRPASASLGGRHDVAGTVLGSYREFAARSTRASAQSPAWVEAWSAAVGGDLAIATVTRDGAPALMLPLEIVARGPFRIARFMGGSHANGNFAPLGDHGAGTDPADIVAALGATVAAARPDIDLILLERQMPALDGRANPFLAAPRCESPNIALAASLEGGFEALLARFNGKRKLKKRRAQTRKFEAAGGVRRFQARTPGEIERCLQAFLEMKHERFRRMGVEDVFAAAEIRAFLAALFAGEAGKARPEFVLDALEVGDRLRSVTGSSQHGRRVVCEFGAISEDELTATSPGDYLAFANIEQACREGNAIYDFSVGDEPYKRSWCDIEIRQFDAFVPLTAKGRVLSVADRGLVAAKRLVKQNPALWTFAKRARAALGRGRD